MSVRLIGVPGVPHEQLRSTHGGSRCPSEQWVYTARERRATWRDQSVEALGYGSPEHEAPPLHPRPSRPVLDGRGTDALHPVEVRRSLIIGSAADALAEGA